MGQCCSKVCIEMGQCCSKVYVERLNVAGSVHGGVGHDYTADNITGGIANEGIAKHLDNGSVTVKIGCDDRGNIDSIPRESTDTRNMPASSSDMGNTQRDSTDIGKMSGDSPDRRNIPRDFTDMGKIPRDSPDIGKIPLDFIDTRITPRDSTDMGNERHTFGDLEHQVFSDGIRHLNAQAPEYNWTLTSTVDGSDGREGLSFLDIDMLNLKVVRVVGDQKREHYLPLTDIVDINMRDHIGKTPLIVAAWKGREGVFSFLVGRGADGSVTDIYSNNILHWACHGGDVEMVTHIVSKGLVDIDSRGKDGYTPVMMAAERGHKDVVILLVQAGCDMSLVTNGGNNILHVTCVGGNIATVKYILSKNCVDINSTGMNKRTAAMIVALRGLRAVFELLVREGCDLLPVNNNNNNILHEACVGGDVGIVNDIVSRGIVGINSAGKYDRTPVMVAAEFGHIDVLELLVRKGGDVNLRSAAGNTILHAACLGGYVKMVSHVLMTTHVDINAQGIKGRTPLMLAAWKGHQDVFKVLVSAGSDVSLVDDGGNGILHVACRGGNTEMVTYLLSKGVADIDATDNQGSTAIMMAKEKKHKAVVDVLSANVKLTSD